MQSKAHTKATIKYEKKAYDKVMVRIRKDSPVTKQMILQAAAAEGMSLNRYFLAAVEEKLLRTMTNEAL